MKIIRILNLAAATFAQFIAPPVPFDTADLYVVPTDTNVVTFGGIPVVTSFNQALSSTTRSIDFSASQSTPSSSSAEPLATIAPSHPKVQASTTSTSDFAALSTPSPSSIKDTAPTISLESSESIDGVGADVVTVLDTFYTTVSCTTSTSASRTKLIPSEITTAATPVGTRGLPSNTKELHNTAAAANAATIVNAVTQNLSSATVVLGTTLTSLSTHECAASIATTRYDTTVIFTAVTEVETVRVTQTHLITVSL